MKHCATLYRHLGVPEDTTIHFAIQWSGLDRLKLSVFRDSELGDTIALDSDTYESKMTKWHSGYGEYDRRSLGRRAGALMIF